MQGSPPRGPRGAAVHVPGQHRSAEAAPDADSAGATSTGSRDVRALPGPRVAPGAHVRPGDVRSSEVLPADLLPGARPGVLRSRQQTRPDAVVFTAACPACGQDCQWSEEREDTRLYSAVHCPCGR